MSISVIPLLALFLRCTVVAVVVVVVVIVLPLMKLFWH